MQSQPNRKGQHKKVTKKAMVQYGFGVLRAFQLGAFWVFNKKIDENNGPPSSADVLKYNKSS